MRTSSRALRTAEIRRLLLSKIDSSDGCWNWTGTRMTRERYAQVYFDGKIHRAHCVSYAIFVGPIPEGTEIDHLCRNTGCINPAHLEAVSHRVNVLRGEGPCARNARKKTCSLGHPYDRIDKHGGRRCSICTNRLAREQRKKRMARRRAVEQA